MTTKSYFVYRVYFPGNENVGRYLMKNFVSNTDARRFITEQGEPTRATLELTCQDGYGEGEEKPLINHWTRRAQRQEGSNQ